MIDEDREKKEAISKACRKKTTHQNKRAVLCNKVRARNNMRLYTRRADIFSTKKDGSWWVLLADKRNAVELNEAGGYLWEALSSPQTAADLAGYLMKSYDIPKDVALRDTQQFLTESQKQGIIQESVPK